MVDRTSTEISPWTLVEANDKRWARVKVLRTINLALEQAFEKSDKHERQAQKARSEAMVAHTRGE